MELPVCNCIYLIIFGLEGLRFKKSGGGEESLGLGDGFGITGLKCGLGGGGDEGMKCGRV